MPIRLAIVGATGLVGQELLRIIEQEQTAVDRLGLLASAASAGQVQHWLGRDWTVQDLEHVSFDDYDAALFCIGDELSARYVPLAVNAHCAVVDKSNAFRLHPDVPLLVAGVNDESVTSFTRLCANPNCSTIILQHAVAPLARRFGIERIWAATYQSVSGSGSAGVERFEDQMQAAPAATTMTSATSLDESGFAYNVIPAIGSLDPLGRCGEEAKLVEESRKVLGRPDLPIAAHAVRVPVVVGHSIAVTVELGQQASIEDLLAVWQAAPDVLYLEEGLPGPLTSQRHDRVEVGRLRREPGLSNGWSFFISGDNLRLGAALNGWRILRVMQRQCRTGSGIG
jgi:aspartate-semialdehyde dehydrogenase